jgi:hypothetical protein
MNKTMLKNNIVKALTRTFSPYSITFTKKNINDSIELYHNNVLFDVSVNEEQLKLKTKYLSPCMYIRHLLIEEYKKEDNKYVLKEIGSIVDDTIIFNSKNNIPIDYMIIMKAFSLHKTNISSIEINRNNDNNTIEKYEKQAGEYLDNMTTNELERLTHKSWNNFKISGLFEVHDKRWKTADIGLNRLKDGKSFTNYTEEILSKINNDLNENRTLFIDDVVGTKHRNNKYFNRITGAAKLQGGVNLEAIFSLFGNSYISRNNESTLLRCIEKDTYNPVFNRYGCCECDLQSIVIFNEFLRKYGQKTTLLLMKDDKTIKCDTNNTSVNVTNNAFRQIYDRIFT